MSAVIVATFYRFVGFGNPERLRRYLQTVCSDAGTLGSIIVAEEGINGTISGSRPAVGHVLEHVRGLPGCADLPHRESVVEEPPFLRMKVISRSEIVTMGDSRLDPGSGTGRHVPPGEWNALIEDDGVVLIDARNSYEIEVGTFPGAINPTIGSFRDFPAWWQANRDRFRGKRVAMFCTGGIRCEKSTSLLLGDGFRDVCQLSGGILAYLADMPPDRNHWRGECFVFDGRVSVGPGLRTGKHSLCHSCRRPLSPEDREHPLYEDGVACAACHDGTTETRRAGLRERQRQVELARERGSAHIGARFPPRAGSGFADADTQGHLPGSRVRSPSDSPVSGAHAGHPRDQGTAP